MGVRRNGQTPVDHAPNQPQPPPPPPTHTPPTATTPHAHRHTQQSKEWVTTATGPAAGPGPVCVLSAQRTQKERVGGCHGHAPGWQDGVENLLRVGLGGLARPRARLGFYCALLPHGQWCLILHQAWGWCERRGHGVQALSPPTQTGNGPGSHRVGTRVPHRPYQPTPLLAGRRLLPAPARQRGRLASGLTRVCWLNICSSSVDQGSRRGYLLPPPCRQRSWSSSP